MIHLIAIITTKPGARATVLEHFAANVPNVHAEAGCIEYTATIDATGFDDMQAPLGDDTFLVVEKWASAEALRAHAASPHMAAYGAKTADLLATRALYILSAA